VIGGSLARRYARALRDIGQEESQLRRILGEVEGFAGLLSGTPEVGDMLFAAHVNRRDKAEWLEGAVAKLGFLPTTKNFLLLLVEKERMDVLPQILVELRRMVEEIEGIERVEVTSSVALSAAQRDQLSAAIAAKTGKKIELEEKIDPAVLGGMVVKVGSTVYDGSVRTQIHQIRENLQKG
jgi:F-type H+-transporting ATPase subunit delta